MNSQRTTKTVHLHIACRSWKTPKNANGKAEDYEPVNCPLPNRNVHVDVIAISYKNALMAVARVVQSKAAKKFCALRYRQATVTKR